MTSLHEFQDSITAVGSVINSRKKLETIIKSRSLDDILKMDEETQSEKPQNMLSDDNTTEEKPLVSPIRDWINVIRALAEPCSIQGNECNAFFAPDFLNNFMDDAYEFPIWSAACFADNAKHSSTACVEGFFHDKKHRVLIRHQGRHRADKFLRLEHRDCIGSSSLFTGKLVADRADKLNPTDTTCSPTKPDKTENINENQFQSQKKAYTHDPDTVSVDNWRNKGYKLEDASEESDDEKEDIRATKEVRKEITEPEHQIKIENQRKPSSSPSNYSISQSTSRGKKGFYFSAQPNIDHKNINLNSTKRSEILKNGNGRAAITIRGKSYLIQNTCPFDSIAQVLATTGMDDACYHTFIDVCSTTSSMMKFLKDFIEKGVTPSLYKQRTSLLLELFPENVTIKSQHSAEKLLPYTLNMYGTTSNVWTKCFQSAPSGYDNFDCYQCGKSTTPIATIWSRPNILCENGVQCLQDAISKRDHAIQACRQCHNYGCLVSTTYNRHVFIEIDARTTASAASKAFKLEDFPLKLQLSNFQHDSQFE